MDGGELRDADRVAHRGFDAEADVPGGSSIMMSAAPTV
jgi:hypothetical protein